jgi:hypothetical protein
MFCSIVFDSFLKVISWIYGLAWTAFYFILFPPPFFDHPFNLSLLEQRGGLSITLRAFCLLFFITSGRR